MPKVKQKYEEIEVGSQGDSLLLSNKTIDLAVDDLIPFFGRMIRRISNENGLVLAEYLAVMKREINISPGYKRANILTLAGLSMFQSNQKNFKEMTREDILQYLDSLRRPESSDPLHKWIGTYNLYLVILLRFFKWLYHPNIEPTERPKPEVVENIARLKRKEQSIYKPSDLWTQEDDLLFLKYCPDKRNRCYHAISRDLSCRPHEILNIRIKDVSFKTAGNYQYAEVLVNGKTGNRPLPLISSIPYVKDWLDSHPQREGSKKEKENDGFVNFNGQYFKITNAKLYTPPSSEKIPLYMAASGEEATQTAAKYTDGLITIEKSDKSKV